MADNPLEQTSALAAYGNARTNDLRRYPSPDRDGSRLYPLAAPSAKPSFRINKADKIFTIGSCFARNVEAALEDVGMEVVSAQRTETGWRLQLSGQMMGLAQQLKAAFAGEEP